jgi:hypothetical protein
MAMAARRRGNGALRVYRSYNFVDKDPVIDQVQTIVQAAGLLRKGGLRKLHRLSGVSESATYNWFFGKTRRPMNASIEAVARALGYHRNGFTRFKQVDDLEAELRRLDRQADK